MFTQLIVETALALSLLFQAETATDQSSKKRDVEVTRQIRRQLMKDKVLSTDAKNVTIITANGAVTLRGKVNSVAERDQVAETAKKLSGTNKINNELEVAK